MSDTASAYKGEVVGLFVTLGAISLISPQTVLTAGFLLCVTLFLSAAILPNEGFERIVRAFVFYSIAAITLFVVQDIALPSYEGFTGMPGIGTDDSYFFGLAVPDMSLGLATELSSWRPQFYIFSHNYSDFLSLFAECIQSVFGTVHPLDLIFVNVAVMALLPSVTSRIVRAILPDGRAADMIWWIMLLCPFTLANSVILIRDGLTAVGFAVALLGVIERRPLLVLFGIACVAYLRLLQGALLVGSLWVLLAFLWLFPRGSSPRSAWMGLVLVGIPLIGAAAALVALPLLLSNVDLLVGLFFREGFLQGWVSDIAARDEGTSTFFLIGQQPLPIRLPLAFAFYFGVPHLAVDELFRKPIFVPRDYLLALFSVAFIAYVAFFVRGLVRAWVTRNGALLGIAAAYLIDVLLISQASMQVRHKVALMPMFYIVVAAGFGAVPARVRTFGLATASSVGAFMILFNGYKLWGLPS